MAAVPSGEFTITTYDAAGKHSNQRVASTTLIAANFLGQEVAATSLLSATEALTNGVVGRYALGNVYTEVPFSLPSDPTATVGTKLAVTYTDNTTGRKYTTQLAVANYAVGAYHGTEDLDIVSAGVGLDYATAFNAFVKSDAGNSVTVLRIRKVSRHFTP